MLNKGGARMRRMILSLLFLLVLLLLCGCAAQPQSALQPDVRLLSRPYYPDEAPAVIEAAPAPGVLRVDLWLDASHTMGGVNLNEDSIYPHHSRKYREGGFHYRFENTVGLYENVLRSMLSAAEGSRVRLLRVGHERLTDELLAPLNDSGAEELRSLRRDLLTYAIDPTPTVFSTLSAENMDGSFYQPGTAMLNRMASLPNALLENPEQQEMMSAVLNQQLNAIRQGEESALALADDTDFPLLYALDNIDLSRLSVIICDPASIRRLTAMDAQGAVLPLVEELLQRRGVFDAGLSAGLYALTLDYMGQLSSFASADLSEPLLWGHLNYNSYQKTSSEALPMPRTLLVLLVGDRQQLASYTASLQEQFETQPVYQELRGPAKGQLVYTRDGQTVTQQPFSFDWEYLQIDRPVLTGRTHHSEGLSLTAENALVDSQTRLVTVEENQSSLLTLTVPTDRAEAALTSLSLHLEDALVLSRTLPNQPDAPIPGDAQVIALRDTLYLYEHQTPETADFSLVSVVPSGDSLVFTLRVGDTLAPGYYHLSLSADYASGGVAWETASWVEALNASPGMEEITAWESFTALMAKYERKRSGIARQFQHAWGAANDGTYRDMPYPDFPPVYKAPGLKELVEQLQSAANVAQTPCLRYAFDVFVTNQQGGD